MVGMLRRRADWLAVGFCIIYVALASAWISEMGIQTDEALFGAGIYPPLAPGVELWGKHRPLMVMTYVGCVKSYIWKPIVRNLGASPATVRLPAVLIGALTLCLFYLLLRRTLGVRTALAGTALLAADATFIVTTRWDWGPVAIQHLCLVGGVLSIVRFTEDRRLRWLALGCFLFGLGLWDKALFAWSLIGLGVATLVVFPRRVLKYLTPARSLQRRLRLSSARSR
jgi:predicted membrane-bound mannosyltransferase